MHSRLSRLTVVVTSALLSIPLAAGCKKQDDTIPPHVNEGPQPEPEPEPEPESDAPTESPAEDPAADFSAGDAEMGEGSPDRR